MTGYATLAQGEALRPILSAHVDESQRVRLEGNTPPPARRLENDRGLVDDGLRLEHLLLVLKGSAESEAALQQLIADMHDPNATAEYHRWLTPQQIGARFGLAHEDLETITSWLRSHGLVVNRVFTNGLVIDFSGSAAQVREALHTEIHNLVLPNGERHIGNATDPEIPQALAAVVRGVASLHNFFPRAHSLPLGPVNYERTTNTWKPQFDIKIDGAEFHTLSPYDFATIYNLLPLWNRGFTGKGVTIAAVEDSNLLHARDWKDFRKTFGLDSFTHGTFQQIYPGCKNPGQNGDETEAALDVEW